jgi:hypothetical protein
MARFAVTCGTSQFRDVVVVLTSSASDIRRHVSDQPARQARQPYTANLATDPVPDRLIADGMQVGYLHAASNLTGMGGKGFTMLNADAPSTQRHSRAARLPPWRCVLSLSANAQTQRGGNAALWGALHCRVQGGVGWIGKCNVHAALRPAGDEMLPDGYSAAL